jgi:hypothetical protein
MQPICIGKKQANEMSTKTNLDSALHKMRRFADTVEWCGCFTPAEIVAIVEFGATPANSQNMDYIRQKVKEGDCKPQWFYFFLSPRMKEIMGRMYDKKGNPHRQAGS